MIDKIEGLYVAEYSNFVKKFARRAGSIENAEDVVQEAFTRAIKYADSFDPTRRPLGAWFNTILNNAFKDHKAAEFPRSDFDDEEEGEELADVHVVNAYADHIREEISNMSQPRRDILHLWFNRNYSYRDITKVLEVPRGTVITTLYRFREEMREKYSEAVRS